MKKITEKTISEFKQYLIDEEKSKSTIEKYVRDVEAFYLWLGAFSLCKARVLQYKQYLIKKYAPASVNSIISSLNCFFEYSEEFALRVKTLKIQQQIFSKKEKELTKAEYERLLSAAIAKGNRKLFLLMQTICATGIRVSELSYITIAALQSGQANINMKGKMRIVIIPHDLCKMLKKYAARHKITSGSVFLSKKRKPLDRTSIWKMMKLLCENAGVSKKKVFPHNLRHLFARTFYSIQKDIVRLADILGHSSVNTTRIYTMETSDVCRIQIQSLGLLRYQE